jgi:hypothetical protein
VRTFLRRDRNFQSVAGLNLNDHSGRRAMHIWSGTVYEGEISERGDVTNMVCFWISARWLQ